MLCVLNCGNWGGLKKAEYLNRTWRVFLIWLRWALLLTLFPLITTTAFLSPRVYSVCARASLALASWRCWKLLDARQRSWLPVIWDLPSGHALTPQGAWMICRWESNACCAIAPRLRAKWRLHLTN